MLLSLKLAVSGGTLSRQRLIGACLAKVLASILLLNCSLASVYMRTIKARRLAEASSLYPGLERTKS
jgi:hypothetical protein